MRKTITLESSHDRCWCGHVIVRHRAWGKKLVCLRPTCTGHAEPAPDGQVFAKVCGTIRLNAKNRPHSPAEAKK